MTFTFVCILRYKANAPSSHTHLSYPLFLISLKISNWIEFAQKSTSIEQSKFIPENTIFRFNEYQTSN